MSDCETCYTKKDFASDQEPRWCPGCGDFSILSSVQNVMTQIGKKKEDVAFVSGIGCSSRFPYYMNTYGFHSIHGRACAIASGLKIHNPDLSVWVITGDGDGLSIGGNHLIHILRRNLDINIILFNNEIYGLTKGQYSPTTRQGTITKSTPYGSLDRVFNPAALAMGAGGTFVARTVDSDPKHMQEMFLKAQKHKGTSLVEVYQNCVIFNDGTHKAYTDKETRYDNSIRLEEGKPILFGKEKELGIRLKGSTPEIVNLQKGEATLDEIVIHDPADHFTSTLVSLLHYPEYPMAMGVLRHVEDSMYEDLVDKQMNHVKNMKGQMTVRDMLMEQDVWEVK